MIIFKGDWVLKARWV